MLQRSNQRDPSVWVFPEAPKGFVMEFTKSSSAGGMADLTPVISGPNILSFQGGTGDLLLCLAPLSTMQHKRKPMGCLALGEV